METLGQLQVGAGGRIGFVRGLLAPILCIPALTDPIMQYIEFFIFFSIYPVFALLNKKMKDPKYVSLGFLVFFSCMGMIFLYLGDKTILRLAIAVCYPVWAFISIYLITRGSEINVE